MKLKRPDLPAFAGVLLCLALTGGCTVLQSLHARPTQAATPSMSESERFLLYIDSINSGGKDFLESEFARLKARATQSAGSADPFGRMQLAALHGLHGQSFSDSAKAATLYAEAARDTASGNLQLHALAVWLQGLAAQQARSDELVQTLGQRVREEQKRADTAGQVAAAKSDDSSQALTQRLRDEQKKQEALQQKHDEAIAQLTQRLKDEQKRADALQQKLDAVTSLEKTLIERNQVKPP